MTTPVDDDARLELLATGDEWAEGPVFTRAGRVRWSDIPGNRVREFDPATGRDEVVDADAEYANGRTLDLEGRIVQCSHGRRRVERVDADGAITSIVDAFEGHRLNSPNDVVVSSDGAIWFTDPPYGIQPEGLEGHPGEEEYGGCHVFRYDESTGGLAAVVLGIAHPNGLAFNADETLLYIADTAAYRDDVWVGRIEVVDVADGRCGPRRLLVELDGIVDGFRVDAEDRLWVSAGPGIRVLDPTGRELHRIEVPETVANLCFGGEDGRDLYITASTSLYRIRTTTTDAADHRRAALGPGA
jgi:gluconolactonase